MDNKVNHAFSQWKKRIKGDYIVAICKPCWELNYCPYGVLVEEFPLSDDEYIRCRIFGHECPVFRVAEPFTETKIMRNISRNIPNITRLKVFRRDNGVCQKCGKNVPFDEINYDHIIPWSKGGSSDEANLRILCETCNKKRSNNFEDESLISVMQESMYEAICLDLNMFNDLLTLSGLWLYMDNNTIQNFEATFCDVIATDDYDTDKFMYMIIKNLYDLLSSGKFISVKKKIDILHFRWGLKDNHIHSINESCQKFKVDATYVIDIEMLLLRQIGLVLDKKSRIDNKYLDMKASLSEEMKTRVDKAISN